jgi:signal transduction histidine kinase
MVEGFPAAGVDRKQADSSWSRHQVDALMRVSNVTALKTSLDDVLAVIASEACQVTRATAASVLLSELGGPFRLGASFGLSQSYNRFLQGQFIAFGGSISRAAADRLAPVVIDDVSTDPLVTRPEATELRRLADQEKFAAIISVPLVSGSFTFGVLNLYRQEPGPWLSNEAELATSFAQHAAGAIDTARLIDSQRRQVEALERMVQVLRDQTHEYANRLHALSGLHALGETDEAQRFLAQLMTIHHENYASVIERIHDPILAGLLVAQMGVARQRGVDIRLHRGTRIDALPPSLGGAEAVTIVANLIENAIEAVSNMPKSRRRASVRISESREAVTIAVRDFGPGLAADAGEEEIFTRGHSSKAGHAGIGLALVSEAVASANGEIEVASTDRGTTFRVTLPRR